MTTAARSNRAPERQPLSRDRILDAAIALADADGLGAVTMRRLGQELGVEAMSLYNHIDNKSDLMDGVVDRIVSQIAARLEHAGTVRDPDDWKPVMRHRILTARTVMLEHKWAPDLIERTASLSPTVIAYFDGLLGILIAGGFSYDLAHHALHALGSRAIGFTQELFEESSGGGADTVPVGEMADHFPNLAAMLAEVVHDGPDDTIGWCDDQTEFIFGLDLLLDGLDRLRVDAR